MTSSRSQPVKALLRRMPLHINLAHLTTGIQTMREYNPERCDWRDSHDSVFAPHTNDLRPIRPLRSGALEVIGWIGRKVNTAYLCAVPLIAAAVFGLPLLSVWLQALLLGVFAGVVVCGRLGHSPEPVVIGRPVLEPLDALALDTDDEAAWDALRVSLNKDLSSSEQVRVSLNKPQKTYNKP